MLLTRAEATEELWRRGYRPGEYPGIWLDPKDKSEVVWFVALQREKIQFNRKDKPWKSKQLEFKWKYTVLPGKTNDGQHQKKT